MRKIAFSKMASLCAACIGLSNVAFQAVAVADVQYISTSATIFGGEYQGYEDQNASEFTYLGFINQSGTSLSGGVSSQSIKLLSGYTETNSFGPYSFSADATGISVSGSAQGIQFGASDGQPYYSLAEVEINYDVHFTVGAPTSASTSGQSNLYANGLILNQYGTPGDFTLQPGVDYEYDGGSGGEIEGIGNSLSSSGQLVFNTTQWAQPESGNWSTASNWTTATVPTTGTDAAFANGSTTPYSVTLTGASSCNNLNVQGDNVGLNTAGNNLSAAGSVSITSNSLTSTPGSLTIIAGGNGNGSLTAANGVAVSSGSYLRGNGTIVGDVSNAGTVLPGYTTPGTLTISGNYTQTATGNLVIRVNGTTASRNFDSLQVSGNVSVTGTLNVALGNSGGTNFIPTNKDTYQIVGASGGVSGTFSNTFPKNLMPVDYSSTGKLAGVFTVNYNNTGGAQSGVTLSNYRPTDPLDFFGVGVNWSNVSDPDLNSVRGDKDAGNIESHLSSDLPNFNSSAAVLVGGSAGLDANVLGTTNYTQFQNSFAQFSSKVGANDTVVFYVSTHGSPENGLLSLDNGDNTDGVDALSAPMIASDLYSLPSSTKKIVILDACHSGIIASQLTVGVSNIAVLAATDSGGEAPCAPDGTGVFTNAIDNALDMGDTNLQQIADDIGTGGVYSGYYFNLLGQTLDLRDSGSAIFEGLQPQETQSSDFNGDLLGNSVSVPEPSILGIVLTAWATALRHRRTKGFL